MNSSGGLWMEKKLEFHVENYTQSNDPDVVTYLKSTTAVRQPVHNITVKQINMHIIAPLNRLQLPVAGTSDGYANTRMAALLTN